MSMPDSRWQPPFKLGDVIRSTITGTLWVVVHTHTKCEWSLKKCNAKKRVSVSRRHLCKFFTLDQTGAVLYGSTQRG